MSTYNGWANRATWRLWVDVFNTLDIYELRDNLAGLDAIQAGELMQQYIMGMIYPEGRTGEELVTIRGWAASFAQGADWNELGAAMLERAGLIETNETE